MLRCSNYLHLENTDTCTDEFHLVAASTMTLKLHFPCNPSQEYDTYDGVV